MDMSPTRPYLVRAIYDWILDNRCTPYLLIDAGARGVRVPRQAVKDGRVVLNIAPHAVDRLELGLEEIRFNARFSGVSHSIGVPAEAVLAIYAQENGQGMMFPAEDREDAAEPEESPEAPVVEGAPAPAAVSTQPEEAQDPAPTPAPDRPRPSLRIVK